MLNDEVISVVSKFFEAGRGPSHDELTRMFKRADLSDKDPLEPGLTIGKMKRCREVLSQALDENPEAGSKLIKMIVDTVRAAGGFRPESENYIGDVLFDSAKSAFRTVGYELDAQGTLRVGLLENLNGREMTDALKSYVRRARLGSSDAALVVGTGKDLLEATARHVLVEKVGEYPRYANFQMTLFQAYEQLGLACPDLKLINELDSQTPQRAVEQALFLLGVAVNRLRNAEGTGHGRPQPPSMKDREAHLAVQSMGLVSDLLLGKM